MKTTDISSNVQPALNKDTVTKYSLETQQIGTLA